MCEWLGLDLDLEPERPEHLPRAPGVPPAPIGVMVRQYVPPTADLWRLGAGRPPELCLRTSWPGSFSSFPACSESKN
jgi:hypothetical protein